MSIILSMSPPHNSDLQESYEQTALPRGLFFFWQANAVLQLVMCIKSCPSGWDGTKIIYKETEKKRKHRV